MTIKISQLGNLTSFTGSTLFPVVDTANAYITVKSTGSTLLNYIAGNLTTLTVNGNITTSGYYFGNGSQLTGMPAAYGNTHVSTYLPVYGGTIQTSNLQTTTANIQASSVDALRVAGGIIAGNVTTNILSATAIATNLYNEDTYYVNVGNTWVYSLSSTITNNILLIFTSNPTTTINMPINPVDGDVVRISANANVVLAVGTGNVSPTFAGANVLVSPLRYIYSGQYLTWFKI
jgi:hypothetical protein